MATRADVDLLRGALAATVSAAQADLERMWARIWSAIPDGPLKPYEVRNALLQHIPRLTDRYGEAAATAAADWYDDLRVRSGATGAYRADVAATIRAQVVADDVRFHAGRLWTDTPQGLLPVLAGVVDQHVKQPGRNTVMFSAGRDPARPRWARVPSGAETCAWCIVMASRGFKYYSEASARAAEPSKYHKNCDCALVVDWSADPRLDGYNPDGYYEIYRQARAEAGTDQLAGEGGILQMIREQWITT